MCLRNRALQICSNAFRNKKLCIYSNQEKIPTEAMESLSTPTNLHLFNTFPTLLQVFPKAKHILYNNTSIPYFMKGESSISEYGYFLSTISSGSIDKATFVQAANSLRLRKWINIFT